MTRLRTTCRRDRPGILQLTCRLTFTLPGFTFLIFSLQLQEILASYSPWGKPGGGAPCAATLRKKNVPLEPPVPPRCHSFGQVKPHGKETVSPRASFFFPSEPSTCLAKLRSVNSIRRSHVARMHVTRFLKSFELAHAHRTDACKSGCYTRRE